MLLVALAPAPQPAALLAALLLARGFLLLGDFRVPVLLEGGAAAAGVWRGAGTCAWLTTEGMAGALCSNGVGVVGGADI